MADTNDFIINITGEINEAETKRRIQEALAKIAPNVAVNIQTTGTQQAVSNINDVSKAIGTTAAVSVEAVKQIENVVKKLIDTTEQLDKSLTNIRIATGDTFTNALDLMKNLSGNGVDLGATTSEMAAGVETWLRQGKSLEQAQALNEETIRFSKVSKKSAEDSAKYLTALSKSYHVLDDDISQITDKLTAIDSNAAVNAGALADGMSKVATTASMAGVSFDDLAAMITTVTEITQQSANSIGNAFKTIFTRMSDIKGGKLQLIDDDGTTEILSDVELTLKNVGIDLRATVNEYNSYSEVLENLADKWDSLSQVQQNALSKAFAGTRQTETFRVLMENYDNVSKYAKIAADSAGSSAEKFNAYLDSVEAKSNSLQAAFEGLTLDIISPESIANVLELTTEITEFLDKTNLAKSALEGIAAGGAVSGLSALVNVVSKAANGMSAFGNALELARSDMSTDEFAQLLNVTKGLSAAQLKAVLSTESLTDAQRMQILTNTGLSEAEARAKLQTLGLSTAENAATASTFSLSGAVKGLWATLSANPVGLVITAVTACAMAFNALKDAQQKAAGKAKEQAEQSRQSAESIKTESAKLDELIAKYKELSESSTFDSPETRSEVRDIQSEITKLVGQQADNLDLVNGQLDDELKKLKEIEQQERDKLIRDQRTAYLDAASQADSTTYHKGSSYIDWAYGSNQITIDGDNGKIRKQITEIVNKAFEDNEIDANVNIQGHDFDKFLSFNFADDSTLRDRINGIETALQALENDTDFDTSTSELYRELSNAQKELQDVLDKQEQAANDLLETLTVNIAVEGQTDVDSLESYKEYRQNIIDSLAKDDTISNAMSEGVLSTDRIETYVDSYLSGIDSISDYYNQWVNSVKADDTIRHTIEEERAKAQAQLESLPKLKLSELFDIENKNGDKFSDTIKKYREDVDKLKTAYDKFKSGELTDTDFAKLIEAFPMLANRADDLDTAISELLNDMNGSLLLDFADKFSRLGTSEDRQQLIAYRDTLLSLSEFADTADSFDISDYTKQIDGITSSVDKLRTAYDSISNGTISDKDMLSLIKDFPELAPFIDDTDKLQQKISKLAKTQPKELIASLEKLKENLTDKTQISSIEKLIDSLKRLSELDTAAGIDGTKEAVSQLEKSIALIDLETESIKRKRSAQQSYLDSLNAEKTQLEELANNYKTAADTIRSAIDSEIGSLEREKSAIEETYNKQIEALRTENEERERANDLREKAIALEKAKNTKERVYTGHGWEVQTNKEQLAKAQKEYDKSVNESRIAELEKERDSKTSPIDEQIAEYNKYKELWNEAIDSYKNAQDEMTTSALLGSNWREDIANKDIGVLNTFTGNYESCQYRLHNVIEPQIKDVQNTINAYDSQITAQNELKSAQQNYLDFYKNYSSEFAKATDEQAEAVKRLNEAILRGMSGNVISKLFDIAFRSIKGYSEGGVNTETGLAMLHGTKQKSEVTFNAEDAKKLYDMIHGTGTAQLTNRTIRNIVDNAVQTTRNNAEIINNSRMGDENNYYSWNITGTVQTDNYETFKGYLDRYVRETNMNRLVGKR
ncbi:phage tail tape measure protein, TP901 family, core region [Ruminococcus sp. YE71]|uniref:phage tail tape measure protein n=1 Tax=unclassified Ruminococcus TaxID=2608920 RepID=UPI00088C70A7|nr:MULTISPECIES: phage tail tape measure protein [unclassified Ruminococcus]SDA29245.1 phage tail tape measure protein, TP901 family, core region [Ruminococcus sp. YE78]SFW47849.1 phage tail tape measure protein, TP901 family, core region [Ruminococcus sp. YE71]